MTPRQPSALGKSRCVEIQASPSSIDSRKPGSSAERSRRQAERWSSEQKKAVVAHSEFAGYMIEIMKERLPLLKTALAKRKAKAVPSNEHLDQTAKAA